MADWNYVRNDPRCTEKLDTEIIPLCDALNDAGFVTNDSCCGHGSLPSAVYFDHSSDERIERLARFIMAREQVDYHPYSSLIQKEIMVEGCRWSLKIILWHVYADTPYEEHMKQAEAALAGVTQAVIEFAQVECARSAAA